MIVKLLTEHHFEFLSLKGGCICSSESTESTLLEITCHGSCVFIYVLASLYHCAIGWSGIVVLPDHTHWR